jgi:hypothetical protein
MPIVTAETRRFVPVQGELKPGKGSLELLAQIVGNWV